MACLIRDSCDGTDGELFCPACVDAVTTALGQTPALLRLLDTETPRSLARPIQTVPSRGARHRSTPAHEHLMDLSAGLVEAVAEWSAITGYPPARTLPGMASACARLAAAPYRYLAALGGVASARATLRATRAARRALALTAEPARLTARCPSCGTQALTQRTEHGFVTCDYCDIRVSLEKYGNGITERKVPE